MAVMVMVGQICALCVVLDRVGRIAACGSWPGDRGRTRTDRCLARRAIDKLDAPVVVVGHSFGGVVISQAAHSAPNVKAGSSRPERVSRWPGPW